MADHVIIYTFHQNAWPLLVGLGVGWLLVLLGCLRWGWRFGLTALLGGLLIPASQLLFMTGFWVLFDPELFLPGMLYWLLPGALIAITALLIRNRRAE